MNLLSIHKFCLNNNCSCHFDAHELKIQDIPTRRLIYKGLSENGVYPIYSKNFIKSPFVNTSVNPTTSSQTSSFPQFQSSSVFHVNRSNKYLLWHHRLGHPSNKVLSTALSSIDAFCPLPSDEILSNYIYCLNGKMHQSPFPTFDFHVSSPLELVHSDVWSPTPVTSTNDFCVLCSLC